VSLCLALDTATDVASVALGDRDDLLVEIVLGQHRAAGTLTPAIEQCLRLAGKRYEDLDVIAVADGPGSFTGLRVAFATVQGIVAQREVPVVVAPSLMVAAFTASPPPPEERPVAAVYDALRGEVFAAVYAFSRSAVAVHLAPCRLTADELMTRCAVRPALAVGDGSVIYAAAMREWTGHTPLGPPRGAPRASSLLALRGLDGGVRSVASLAEFEPAYGRQAEAQVRWEREHGRRLDEA
jgi:tRNA threonylcarbamoyladenosine biosynthesis protein TsaB